MSEFYNNSIFWVEVDRISPNPYQPRKEFNDDKIAELADSIRQYGVLQPLVVTRKETEREDGGIAVEYELIAGERRLRASKLAMIPQVPVIIRAQEETNKMKLELAIIENLQREDLNAIDRAMAFKQLVDEFNLKHIEVAKKVGKSREYVSNTLRLLGLPKEIQNAVIAREISEGHARPLLMLGDERAAERDTLFAEIKEKKLTVRESERIARRIATDKARKQDLSPELITIEKNLTETLGTRVQIEQRSKQGGKVHIDYFSEEDLKRLLDLLAQERKATAQNSIGATGQKPVNKTVPAAAAIAPEAIKKAKDAIDTFNATFDTPAPAHKPQAASTAQKVPAPTVDPFKQFEIPVPQAAPLKDPFADLPPLPPLPTAKVPAATPAPMATPKEATPDAPFNPFAQISEPVPTKAASSAPKEVSTPKNPFADLPPLPPMPNISEYDTARQAPEAVQSPVLPVPPIPTEPFNPFAVKPQQPVAAPEAVQTPQAPKAQAPVVEEGYEDDDLYSIKNFSL